MQDVETIPQTDSINFYLDNKSEEELPSITAYFFPELEYVHAK